MISVVIVDDDIDVTEGLSELFQIKKIDVVGIGYNGKQAIELCAQHTPDFLILDLTMPEFDGFYALKKLQNTLTKIIVVTGVIDENTLEKLNNFSVFSIQRKPLKFDDLFKIMNIS